MIYFSGREIYFSTKTYLVGTDDSSIVKLPPGNHRYNFSCHLPFLLPESFEASHGFIRYELDVVLSIPWKIDKKFKRQFTVVRHDDLNHNPQLKLPCHSEEIKHFWCGFCLSEPLIMTVTMPFSGYAPGQTIHVTVNYFNKSTVDVSRTKILLKRIISYIRYNKLY